MLQLENRKWWVLGAMAFSLIAVGLDLTVLNLALPTLAVDLRATNTDLQWFADAYNLVLAAVLLPAGLLGDRFGRKKLLLLGLALFGAASVWCAFSGTSVELITGRALLGLGAAFLMPLSMAIIPVLFTEEERPKAIAIWTMSNAIGIPLGPIVGGWLLKHYWWGSVFLINLPIIVIGFAAVVLLLPESRSSEWRPLDKLGILVSSLGLVGLTYGVIEAGERGWSDPQALSFMLAGILLLAGFVVVERRVRYPLMELSLFRSPAFTWGAVLATMVSFVMFGLLFVTPQYFQAVEGSSAFGTGLRLLPIMGGLLVGAKVSEGLKTRLGHRLVLIAGFLLLTVGFALGSFTRMDFGYGYAALWISLVGIGLGFALPAAMDIALGVLSAERSGAGSALIMAMRQVGGTIGVAVLGTVLSNGYRDKLAIDDLPGAAVAAIERSVSSGVATAQQMNSAGLLDSIRSAFLRGMDLMLVVCGGAAVLGLILTLSFLSGRNDRIGFGSEGKNVEST